MKIILAQTAASGAIYTRQIAELLLTSSAVEQVALIRSENAQSVAQYEGVELPLDERIVEFSVDDMFSPVASGSARYDAMIIAPCSAGTMGRIATGVSDNLITRAADVMLKERRMLLLLLRESPLSLIHIRNMATVTEAGAIVMPAAPSFYFGESSVEELCMNLSRRVVRQVGVDCESREFGAEE